VPCIFAITYINDNECNIKLADFSDLQNRNNSRSRSIKLETDFTPYMSLIGGALIGLSAVLLMATHGRIAGISGIVSRLLPPSVDRSDLPQGLIFIVGLLLAAPVWHLLAGQAPIQTVSGNLPLLAIAGLLVGLGTVLGSGCTSGHGVCGISRLSGRSIVATLTFMSTGFLTVLILRHVVGG